MPRPKRTPRPAPIRTVELAAATRTRPGGGRPLWAAYKGYRVVATPQGLTRFAAQVRRRRDADCPRHNVSRRAEAEGDIAPIGRLRHVEHRSVTETHDELVRRGVASCSRRRHPTQPGRDASSARRAG